MAAKREHKWTGGFGKRPEPCTWHRFDPWKSARVAFIRVCGECGIIQRVEKDPDVKSRRPEDHIAERLAREVLE